jgi:hypothetical protein
VSPKEVKKEIKKLIYEKPVLIGLGDTLNLGAGAVCGEGSYYGGRCTAGHSATGNCQDGYAPLGNCGNGVWK